MESEMKANVEKLKEVFERTEKDLQGTVTRLQREKAEVEEKLVKMEAEKKEQRTRLERRIEESSYSEQVLRAELREKEKTIEELEEEILPFARNYFECQQTGQQMKMKEGKEEGRKVPALIIGETVMVECGREYVFMEKGTEVRKMPVLINGETVWVECVPNSASAEQQESEIMMELGVEENVETRSAVKISSAAQ